jgi:hypothetical protein
MKTISSFNDNILIEGCQYNVGTNDGKEFSEVAFEGFRKMHGKNMMVFKTNKNRQITINPSYMSYSIETETEMNPVIYQQQKGE